jgi:hypothetical protein
MSQEHPRLLVVTSNTFGQYTGGGITLTNLFRGWPRDRIAMLHADPLDPATEVCERFYRLTAQDVRHWWPVRLGLGIRRSADGASGRAAAGRPASVSQSPSGAAALAKRFVCALDESREMHETVAISPPLRQWLDEVRPEIIYTHLGDLTFLRLTQRIAPLTGCAVAFHIMDNWLETRYRRGLMAPFLHWQMQRRFRRLVQGASARLCISERMAAAYSARFGHPFAAFHNVLETERWLAQSKEGWDPHEPFTILYSGSIEANQVDALVDCVAAVSRLHAQGARIELHIHTPDFYAVRWRARLEAPGVSLREPLLNRDVARRLAQADLLLLAVNFDAASEQYFRYSMPTKLPAYMLSACPILIYGPAGIESAIYAREGDWAMVVDSPGIDGLTDAIMLLRSDSSLRRTLGLRARDVASRDHDAAEHRPRFQAALVKAAQAGKLRSRP